MENQDYNSQYNAHKQPEHLQPAHQQPAHQQPAYPPQQPAYLPQQPAYPPQQPAYLPQQPGMIHHPPNHIYLAHIFYLNFTLAIILSGFVYFYCCVLFGLIAFILASESLTVFI